MPDHAQPTAATPPPKLAGVRFGLRDLLLAVAVVAVYLAAYVFILRGIHQRDVVELGGLAAATVVGTVLALVYLPRWVDRRAGPTVVSLRRNVSRVGLLMSACALPLLVMLLVAMIGLVPAWYEPKVGGTTGPSFVRGMMVLVVTQYACFVLNLVARRSLKICERGIVSDGVFFAPWRRIGPRDLSLDDFGKLVGRLPMHRVVAVVPPDERNAVDALLADKLGGGVAPGEDD